MFSNLDNIIYNTFIASKSSHLLNSFDLKVNVSISFNLATNGCSGCRLRRQLFERFILRQTWPSASNVNNILTKRENWSVFFKSNCIPCSLNKSFDSIQRIYNWRHKNLHKFCISTKIWQIKFIFVHIIKTLESLSQNILGIRNIFKAN